MLNVLITGAASGIGAAVKDYYLNNGHKVIAIDIKPVDNKENLTSFVGDITSEEHMLKIKEQIKGIQLDLIINVAGIHFMASLVETDFQKMKKMIDINLGGTILVNNTFHSLLKEKGRIIIVTSEVASFDPMPFNGLYNISKTALDCYSQALRQELNLINQKVITIRPGAIKTPLSDNSISSTETLASQTVLFNQSASKFSHFTKKFMGTPLEASKLAKLIYKVSIKKRPKLVYKKHQNIGLVLLSVLPKRTQCRIIKLLLKNKKTK